MEIFITKANRVKLKSVSINKEKIFNLEREIKDAGHKHHVCDSKEDLDKYLKESDLIITINNIGAKKDDYILEKINNSKKQRGALPLTVLIVDDPELLNINIGFNSYKEYMDKLDYLLLNNNLIPTRDYLLKKMVTRPILRDSLDTNFQIQPCYLGSYRVDQNYKPWSKEQIISEALPFLERDKRLIYVGKLSSRASMVKDFDLNILDFAVIKKELENNKFPKAIEKLLLEPECGQVIKFESRNERNEKAYLGKQMFSVFIQDLEHQELAFNTGRFTHGIIRGMPSIRVNDEVSEQFKFLPLVKKEIQKQFLSEMTENKWLSILEEQASYHFKKDAEFRNFLDKIEKQVKGIKNAN